MFHWICPECGQEIAPGVKECPVCEPQAIASAVPSSDQPTAVAPTPEVTLAEPVSAPPPAVTVAAVVVDKPAPEPQVILQPEIVLQPKVVFQPKAILQPKAFTQPKPPMILDAIPAEARPVMMPDVPLGTSPVELPDPLMDGSYEPANHDPETRGPETFADRLADLAELLHGESIPYSAPRSYSDTVGARPRAQQTSERAPIIVDVTPAQPSMASPPSVLLLAEPQAPEMAAEIPMEELFDPRPVESTVRILLPVDAEPSASSPVRLPEPPSYVPAPALAPPQDYSDAAERQMRAAESVTNPSARVVPAVTLPGPALPRQLLSLQAAGLVPIRRRGHRPEASPNRYGWMTKYVVMGMILLTGGVATYTVLPGSPSSQPPRPSPEPAPEPPVSARSANSLARFVEVTGIRFMEVNKKPQIHYLVVNHSSAPLGSVTVYVTLRASHAKPGQPPIARLTFRSPDLAAFEAKEMFSSIERASAPLDLPDWQDLHADVEVQ